MDNEVIAILSQYSAYSPLERCDEAVAVLQERGLNQPACLLSALAVDDAEVRGLALEVLAELEPAEVTLPAVIYSLDDSDRLVRLGALKPLVRFGKKAITAIPVVERWLGSDDRFERLLAANAICRIDSSQTPRMLPVFIEGLENGCPSDKSLSADIIGHLGEAGAPAMRELEALLWDECAGVQCEAASAISKITGDPTVEISVCINLLRAEEWLERYVGIEHLALMEAAARPALADLRRVRDNDEDESVREKAKIAIEQICRSNLGDGHLDQLF
jgi:HEAT repeat protein